MSKVKIEGHGTGTGTFTVTTPSSNTDRTITLPDSTGTLATTAGGVAQLDHSGTKKLEATSTGATLTGDLAINDAHPEITFTDSDDTSYSVAYHSAGGFLIDVDKGQDVANSYFRLSIDDTPRLRVTADGLLFNSDTAAANALDDYEEGTWSPVFKGSTGSAGSWAQSTWTSTYTKVGRTVFVSCAGYITNVGSYTGTAIITGLPFTSSFGEHSPLSVSGFANTTTYGTGTGSQPLVTCVVNAAGSQITFKAGIGQDPGCPWSIVRTGYYVQVAGVYTAT